VTPPPGGVEDIEHPGWRVYRVDAGEATPGSYDDTGDGLDLQGNGSEEEEVFQDSDYADEPVASQKWVQLFYAILLLAISLPFLLQLIAQLARIFEP
jgi:hypothetical protein